MRKTLSMKSFVHLSRGLVGAAFMMAAATFAVSCEKHSNSERNESIAVYVDPIEREPVDVVCVGVKGGIAQLYVKSNVDFKASWEDADTSPWITVTDYSAKDPKTGYRIVTLKVKPRSTASCYYTRRTGMLILSAVNGGLNYNKYVTVHQGATARVSSDFSYLKYGKTDPRFTDGETPIEDWTTAQKNYGFSSTVIAGETKSHCYGKNGYLKLGDDKGHGADLISPFTSDLRRDSLVMVSFRAVAFTDYATGQKDANKIKVDILGGGVIADFAEEGITSIEFEAPYYDPQSEEFPDNMWEHSDFIVFVASTNQNPITVNTQLRITCGSLSPNSDENNRIFLDNFYIRRLTETDEPYFDENEGSGEDRILGSVIYDDVEDDVVEQVQLRRVK